MEKSLGKKLYQWMYGYINPLNIILATTVILLNSVLAVYYYPISRTLTSKLFILIAVADVLFAIGHVVPAWAEVLYFRTDPAIGLHGFWRASLCFRFLLSAYFCSIFFNVVLALLRTIRIVFPFYQPFVFILGSFTACYCVLMFILSSCDVYQIIQDTDVADNDAFWMNITVHNFEFPFPGTSLFPKNDRPWQGLRYQFGITLYIIPIIIVLVCWLTQIVYVKYIERSTDHTPLIDWDHINTTVLLLSLSFSICNGAVAVTWLWLFVNKVTDPQHLLTKPLCVFLGLVHSTLPLIYAILFPAIIVARNSNLRNDMTRRLRMVFFWNVNLPTQQTQYTTT